MEAVAIKEANLVQAQERTDQAEQLAIAQKTICEQKVKILELEDNERNSAMEYLKTQNSSMLTTISDYQDLVERISKEKDGLEKKLEFAQNADDEKASKIRDLIKDFQEERSEKNVFITHLKTEIENLKNAFDDVQENNEIYNKRHLEALELKNRDLVFSLDCKDQLLDVLKKDLETCQQKLDETKKKSEWFEINLTRVVKNLESKDQRLADLQFQCKLLTRDLEQEKAKVQSLKFEDEKLSKDLESKEQIVHSTSDEQEILPNVLEFFKKSKNVI